MKPSSASTAFRPMRFFMTPTRMRWALNCWPPLLGAGIRVRRIAEDWRTVEVTMPLNVLNRNIVRTHFGGSLYAMSDPFFMLMLMGALGDGYWVWDASAQIQFLKPGRRRVNATFTLSDADLQTIRAATEHGDKHFHTFDAQIIDADQTVIATVRKVLYIRKKNQAPEP